MSPEGILIEQLLHVEDRDGTTVPFVLNDAQRKLDAAWTGRDLVPKARRLGISTYILARFTICCTAYENKNAVVISHEADSTERLLETVQFFLKNWRGPKPVYSYARNRIAFPKMGSSFYIGTAGAKNFGRGDSIHYLHCSEFAYWPEPERLFKGLAPSVAPTGDIVLESTGNGMDGYAQRCLKAMERQRNPEQGRRVYGRRYHCHFFNWLDEPVHRIELTEEEKQEIVECPDLELQEDEVVDVLTPEQLAFRRQKIVDEMSYDVAAFKQEFPITLEECFQTSGASLFWKVNFKQDPAWGRYDPNTLMLSGHPRVDRTYILGADPAGGVGLDNAVVQVFCVEDRCQVLEWASNKIAPDSFAGTIKEIGERYNNALAVVESNNHGIVTLSELQKNAYQGELYINSSSLSRDDIPMLMRLGFKTTEQTKKYAIGLLRKAVVSNITIYSEELRAEMHTYIEHDTGKIGAQDGFHDDRVMAAAILMVAWDDVHARVLNAVPEPEEEEYDPFKCEAILDELMAEPDRLPKRLQNPYNALHRSIH